MSDIDFKHADIRVVETYIARGIITREQYDAYLEGLEDSAELGEETETRMTASEPDDQA